MASLRVRVVEICGHCPVYQEGGAFWIEAGYKLRTDIPICMHSLSCLMPYYAALSRGVPPAELGLARRGEAAYVQCPDPHNCTGGGTVILEITRED
jgi:uncharacterized repeat protein (TIGR04076 family)